MVDALVGSVRAAYPRLSHRYYQLKAGWFKKKKLAHWDRNAPLPFAATGSIAWPDASNMVLTAYRGFSPEMADIAERFFTDRWIDAPVRPGKAPGAFSHPTTPSAHPYVLMNYQGKPRDVMTLAHELGHGVHQVLAAKNGALMAPTPLTLAETASVFGEMLTFKRLLAQTRNARQRQALLAGKVEDMINTVVRQIAFYSFERAIHTERRNGELTAERIGEIWLSVQGESLGPAIDIRPGYENFWMYIPHFIHSPFYVYAYAFGDCLVNSLYAVYENAADGFAERYLAMLAAGGTKHYSELLKPFGLDAKDPKFWDGGLSVIVGHDRRAGNDGLTRSRMIDTPTRRAVLGAGVFAAGSLARDRSAASLRPRFRSRPHATTATKQHCGRPKGRSSSRPRPSGSNCLKPAWRGSRSNWSALCSPAAASRTPAPCWISGRPTTRAGMTIPVSACAAINSPTRKGAIDCAASCPASIPAAPAIST